MWKPANAGRRAGRVRRGAVLVAAGLVLAGALVVRMRPREPERNACTDLGARPPAAVSGARPGGVPAEAQAALVLRVIDGDGVCVQAAEAGPLAPGTVHELRLIGINAPGEGRCGSREAKAFVEERTGAGTVVRVLGDEQDADRYGRLLRYVWDEEGVLLNVEAVRTGSARELVKHPNERYANEIHDAEARAREQKVGVWRCLPWRFLTWLR